MDIQRINQHTSAFNEITHYIESDNGKEKIEVWFARELQTVLGYARWENFMVAIGRAVESCKSQNINVDDHFREVTKMISLAKGAKREVKDYMLTRFACYLIAQNGDPKKEEIAFAQGYFALQTRRAELIAEHLQQVSRLDTHMTDCALRRNNCRVTYTNAALTSGDSDAYVQKATRLCLADIPPRT